MVIQLSKLFRINVAGLLDADGATLVLDETTGAELVTTLAGALGLTVGAAGAAGEVESTKEEKVQVVDGPRFNPRIGDTMHRPHPQGAVEAAASARHWTTWRVWERIGETLTVVPSFGAMEGKAEKWNLDFWMKAWASGWTYARGETPKRDIIAEAVAAAISAPAPVVTPTNEPAVPAQPSASSDAPPPLADRAQSVQRIHAYLTECGAATVNDIADDLGYDRSGVHRSLTQNNDLFATAGRRAAHNSRLKPPTLWDLRERATVNVPVTCAEQIVAYLQEHESATAKALVGATGMSQVGVDNALSRLAHADTIEKCGRVFGTNGRPSNLWRLKADTAKADARETKPVRKPGRMPDGRMAAKAEALQRVLDGKPAADSTIGTVEAGQTSPPELAPDFLPAVKTSGAPDVVAPLPPALPPADTNGVNGGHQPKIIDWLRANGPASCAIIGQGLNLGRRTVRDSVRKSKVFGRVGRAKEGAQTVDVWGLVGVHVTDMKPAADVKAADVKPVMPEPQTPTLTPSAVPTPAPAPIAQTRRPIKSSTAVRTDRFVDRLHKLLVVNGPRFADDLAFTTGEPLACVVTTLNAWESDRFTRTGRTIPTPGGLPRVEWAAISDVVE